VNGRDLLKVSDFIVSQIESRGIGYIFGYIGGTITHLVDSIERNPKVQFIQTYHEQSAALAADGYARISGKCGVAIATSGPGVTNLITGIADAYFDSIPMVYLTGQVNTNEYKYDKPIRQQGFQELQVCELVAPIVKYVKLVDRPEQIQYELEKAFDIATSGRPGPVLLDIPMDVQRAEVDPSVLSHYSGCPVEPRTGEAAELVEAAGLIGQAVRPMVLVGGGCNSPRARAALNRLLASSEMPFVTSLMGRGLADETLDGYMGMIGAYGNRCANMGVSKTDLLIALGSRLDTRQTGAMLDGFLPQAKIIHVDLDPGELESHRLANRTKVNLSVEEFLESLDGEPVGFGDYGPWNEFLTGLAQRYGQAEEVSRFVEISAPYVFLEQMGLLTGENDVVCVDVGQNQMWAAQTLRLSQGQRFLTSGGLATMGFALPAAVGCAFAEPGVTTYAVTGDGGFHMALQSLLLVSQYDLPVKVFVLNNQALGMITQFQHLYFEDRMAATTAAGGYLVPGIRSLCEAYGVPYVGLSEADLADDAWRERVAALRNCVVELRIDGLTTVSPKLEFDMPIERPSPQLSEAELVNSLQIGG
jgi:acetolactate synthase I/II/III large subunit